MTADRSRTSEARLEERTITRFPRLIGPVSHVCMKFERCRPPAAKRVPDERPGASLVFPVRSLPLLARDKLYRRNPVKRAACGHLAVALFERHVKAIVS